VQRTIQQKKNSSTLKTVIGGEISKRLIRCAGELPSLIERLTEVLELPSLTETRVVAIEAFTEWIENLNEAILRTVNAEDAPLPYKQSLASEIGALSGECVRGRRDIFLDPCCRSKGRAAVHDKQSRPSS